MSAGFSLLLFVTGIPLAIYANQWDNEIKAAEDNVKDTLERLPPALRAASVRQLSENSTSIHCVHTFRLHHFPLIYVCALKDILMVPVCPLRRFKHYFL